MRPIRFRLFRRGRWWWLDIRRRGQRRREPCGTCKRSEADLFLEHKRAELGDPTYLPPPPGAYTVDEAVADFCDPKTGGLGRVAGGTADMYASKAGHIGRLCGQLDVGELTPRTIQEYLTARRGEGAKEHTLAKELTTWRQVLGWAQAQGHLAPGWRGIFPERFQSAYEPRDRWLEEREYLALLQACEPERRLWVTVGVFTGGRESELKRLDCRRDLDFQRGFVLIHSAKCRKGKPRVRHIPMAPELRRALVAAGARSRIGPLFPSPWKNAALMLTRMARKAGICGPAETLNDNDMRRTFASWMLQKGATVAEVAELLGHASTALVERVYGHLAKQNLVDAVGRLPEFRRRRRRGRSG